VFIGIGKAIRLMFIEVIKWMHLFHIEGWILVVER
jgi:hypothetical protein